MNSNRIQTPTCTSRGQIKGSSGLKHPGVILKSRAPFVSSVNAALNYLCLYLSAQYLNISDLPLCRLQLKYSVRRQAAISGRL